MFKNYLKITYKVLLRQKFFTFVSLFGIGTTLTVLIVVTAMAENMLWPGDSGSMLSRALFVERISLEGEKTGIESLPSYNLLKDHVKALKTPELVTLHTRPVPAVAYVDGRKVILDLKYTDAEFWPVAEFRFIEGRPYSNEDVENVEAVAVISSRTRAEVFGKTAAEGKYIETTTGNFRVIGVVPQEDMTGETVFADIWVPVTQSTSSITRTKPYGNCSAIIVPHEGGSVDEIKAEFAEHLTILRADLAGEFDRVDILMGSLLDILVNEMIGPMHGATTIAITAMIAIAILFMLLPAMNLVNMNISRIFERSSEIGVRKAFGASVWTLVAQFVVENVVLTLGGGVIAVGLSFLVLNALNGSGALPFAHFTMNWIVLAYSVLFTLFFGVFSGVLPAYRMSRLHPVEALRGIVS